jgi:small ligand-binding sensory domain FIST
MKWASAISQELDLEQALDFLRGEIEAQMGADRPDLVMVFTSPHHATDYELIPRYLDECFPEAVIVGCSGGSVIGSQREFEREPAIAVLAGNLPDVAIEPFWMNSDELTEMVERPGRWRNRLHMEPEHQPVFVIFPDPFTCDGQDLVGSLQEAFPEAVTVGGLVSGGRVAGAHALFLQADTRTTGVIGIGMYGDIVLDPIVSQGARPIGKPMIATRSEERVIYELDGSPAVQVLDHLMRSVSKEDRELFRRSPMIGLATDPNPNAGAHTDYLVRNLLGVDRSTGRIGINAKLGSDQKIQFHVRDADASRRELENLLAQYRLRELETQVAGALMFSCLGRGSYFFGEKDHDASLLTDHMGELPMAGFFCNGELGPVKRRTWVHGYTTVFGLFRSRGWS